VMFKDDPTQTPSLQTRCAAAGVAGCTATTFSLPFDLIKSRLRKCISTLPMLNIPTPLPYLHLSVMPSLQGCHPCHPHHLCFFPHTR
jgi:hypothetical protein